MARKYSKKAAKKVKKAMEERKKGTLRSGPGGKGGKVKSKKQAIAIGLSEAPKAGARGPKKKAKKTAKKNKKQQLARYQPAMRQPRAGIGVLAIKGLENRPV